jgi:hypothetical protein
VNALDPLQGNRYVYVGDNPVNFIDASGMCGSGAAVPIFAGIAAAALEAGAQLYGGIASGAGAVLGWGFAGTLGVVVGVAGAIGLFSVAGFFAYQAYKAWSSPGC